MGFQGVLRAQTWPVGHRTVNFTDASRNNRPVPTEIYYPAVSAGESTPVAAGLFPIVVFGHGFQMGYDSYFYFRDALVPAGYILVFPKTETSLAPDHAAYGADLAFLVVQMKSEGIDPASPFFQHIDSTSAVMGHSMGGGASFLGCKDNVVPTVMVTWAAAETNPSAVTAASNITIPALVFSADKDCVTPPATNQQPMYDSLASDCKVFINIKGGGHCYFADANFICSLGEIGCPSFTISRDQQHATTIDFTRLYLDHYLKAVPGAWAAFTDSLNTSPRINSQKSCTVTALPPSQEIPAPAIYPNPSGNLFRIEGTCKDNEPLLLTVSDMKGRAIATLKVLPASGRYSVDIESRSWAAGTYLAGIRSAKNYRTFRLVKE